MDIWDIAKTVGASALNLAIPGAGSAILSAVNEFLPDDKKLPEVEKQFDVDITQIKESNSTLRAMLESDAKNPHSTRPKIAYQAFQVVAGISLMIVSGWLYAIVTGNDVMVKAIVDGWVWVAAILLPFVSWLNSYFGILKSEHKHRLDAASGIVPSPTGIAGVLSAVLKR